jgi:hypothetical protein
MSDHLPLDKHIKEQLGGYSPDVPPHIWDRIVAQREQQRPKGFWFRFVGSRKWLLLAILFLGLGGAAYWMTRETDTKTAADRSDKGSNTNLATPTSSQPVASNQPLPANTISNKETNNTTQPNSNNVNTNTATSTGANKTSSDNNNPTAQPVMASSTPVATSNGQDMPPLYTSNRTKQQTQSTNKKMGTKTRANQKPANGTDWVDAPISVGDDGKNSRLQLTKPRQDAVETSLQRMTGAASIITSEKQMVNELQKRSLYNLLLPDCPTIEENAAANKKYIEFYAGPDFGLRSFSSFSADSNSNNYIQRRKESAKFASAFSAGLRYTKVFNNGMSLRSGINYSQINEKFQYINERDIRYILVITPRQIIVGGNTVTIYDTLRYTETGKRIKTTYNRYRSIDVPLQLGYEFGNGRLHTNISAGAIINLYSWQKGDVLDSAYQPVSITTGKGSSLYGFKTNIGVGFLGSVSVYYRLRPRLHLLAEPYFRYNLQPMTRDNQNVTQKYSTLGLRLGVRWDFK